MASQTIKLQRRGPGRPKVRDTETTTLNLDRKVMTLLREMSAKYGMPINHVIETLVLSATRDAYPLQVKEENERLKKRIKMLESEVARLKEKCGAESLYARKVRELRERAQSILGEYGEMKVFELVMKLFGIPRGERLHNKIEEFLSEYFIETDSKSLTSKDLGLVIIKTSTGMAGGIVRKLEDA